MPPGYLVSSSSGEYQPSPRPDEKHDEAGPSGRGILDPAPPSYGSSSPDAANRPPAPEEVLGMEQGPATGEDDPREPGIVLLRDRGVQVGDHNVQVNTYDCTLKKVDLDLETVLQRRDVQTALAALALEPDDPGLRRVADRALGAKSFFAALPDVQLDRGATQKTRSAVPVFGFLFAQDCQGLQAGSHNRQENHFVYYASTTVDARQLFHDSAELRGELLDSIRRAGAASPELAVSLEEALTDAVGHRIDARSLSTAVVPEVGATVIITDRDAVSIGHHCRQVDEAQVTGARAALGSPAAAVAEAAGLARETADRTREDAALQAGDGQDVWRFNVVGVIAEDHDLDEILGDGERRGPSPSIEPDEWDLDGPELGS